MVIIGPRHMTSNHLQTTIRTIRSPFALLPIRVPQIIGVLLVKLIRRDYALRKLTPPKAQALIQRHDVIGNDEADQAAKLGAQMHAKPARGEVVDARDIWTKLQHYALGAAKVLAAFPTAGSSRWLCIWTTR